MSYLRLASSLPDIAPASVACVAGVLVAIAEFGIKADLPLAFALIGYVTWMLSNFFFEVLEHQATGRGGWPVLSLETIVGRRRQLGVVYGLLALAAYAAYASIAATLGQSVAVVFVGLCISVLPASLAMLALTGSAARAVNPLLLSNAALRMGLDYGVALLAAFAAAAAVTLAATRRGFLEAALAAYVFLACAYAIGWIVYKHRLALGVRAPRSPEALAALEQTRLERERAGVIDHAYGMTSRGNTRGGLAYIESYLEGAANPLAAREWMFERMTRWEDPAPALIFGRDLLERLADEDAAKARKLELRCAVLEDAARRYAAQNQ